MIEIIVKNHVERKLDVPVYLEFPSDAPARLVVLRKGGSSREDFIDSAMFVAESYAESLLEAARLNEQVKAAMDSLVELPSVSASARAGDYPAFDTARKRHRYQAVFNITHY